MGKMCKSWFKDSSVGLNHVNFAGLNPKDFAFSLDLPPPHTFEQYMFIVYTG